MPLLSIIIPVYNVEDYLEECLNSILNQEFNDYEIILVNNASIDKSGDIATEYESKYSNVKVIHLDKNRLLSGARNVGLQKAKGEYIHFCDSDDIYIEDTFQDIADTLKRFYPQVLLGKFKSTPEKGAYVCNDVQLDASKFQIEDTNSVIQYISNTPNFLSTVWRFIVRRDLLEKGNIVFTEGSHSEDEEWVPKILCKSETFALIEKPFYCYRPRATNSITSNRTFFHSKSKLIIAMKLLEFLQKESYVGIRKEYICSRINMLLGTFTTACDTFNKEEIHELSNIIKDNQGVFKNVNQIRNRNDLFDNVETYGPSEGLAKYCRDTIKKTLDMAEGKKDKDIYVFPTGNNGEATARILRNAGYEVRGFFDNSISKNNCYIDGLLISLPDKIQLMLPDEIDKIFIIISVQQKEIANKITNQLIGYGLNNKQIVRRIY